MTDTFVDLPAGKLRGTSENGITRFLSVPYAAPPVGKNRFALPQPVEPWDGVRDATVAGATAPQYYADTKLLDIWPLAGPGWVKGDDYLTLNIWQPEGGRAGMPVMIFIHGGGQVQGSKDHEATAGTSFARDGVLTFAINYRLGIEGFLPIPGVPENLGLHDAIAAIEWIRAHAASFGGDPDNITVFGQSGGAVMIGCLMVSPRAKGLFRRVILQSAYGVARSRTVMQRVTARLAKELRIPVTKAGFESVSFEDGVKAQVKISSPLAGLDLRDEKGIERAFQISRFTPLFGDELVPEQPMQALATGAGAEVDMLIGTTAEEMNAMMVVTGVRRWAPKFIAKWILGRSWPDPVKALKSYGMGKGVKPGHALTDAANDLIFRWPARMYAEAHQGRTHFYEFEWRSPALKGDLGAAHGVELPFVFDTLPCVSAGPKAVLGEHPPQAVADRMHGLWVRYATDGTLPWPEYDAATRQVFMIERGEAVHEPPMPAAALMG